MKMGKFSLNFYQVDLNQLVNEISVMIRIQLQLRPSVSFEQEIISDDFVTKEGENNGHQLDTLFVTDA